MVKGVLACLLAGVFAAAGCSTIFSTDDRQDSANSAVSATQQNYLNTAQSVNGNMLDNLGQLSDLVKQFQDGQVSKVEAVEEIELIRSDMEINQQDMDVDSIPDNYKFKTINKEIQTVLAESDQLMLSMESHIVYVNVNELASDQKNVEKLINRMAKEKQLLAELREKAKKNSFYFISFQNPGERL